VHRHHVSLTQRRRRGATGREPTVAPAGARREDDDRLDDGDIEDPRGTAVKERDAAIRSIDAAVARRHGPA
jgi:hypothetical protein